MATRLRRQFDASQQTRGSSYHNLRRQRGDPVLEAQWYDFYRDLMTNRIMKQPSQAGFSYIDVMIAIVILTIGILALMAGMSAAVLHAKGQDQQMIAKQTAASTMESIMSVKETDPDRMGWTKIGNVGTNPINGVPQGIFVAGMQNVFPDAGPDQILGTSDDTGTPSVSLQREIVITDQCDPDRPSYNCPIPGPSAVRIRSVQVKVRYFVGSLAREEQLTTVLTDYAVEN